MKKLFLLFILQFSVFAVTIKTVPSENFDGIIVSEALDNPVGIWESNGTLFYQSLTNSHLYRYEEGSWIKTNYVGIEGNQFKTPKKY